MSGIAKALLGTFLNLQQTPQAPTDVAPDPIHTQYDQPAPALVPRPVARLADIQISGADSLKAVAGSVVIGLSAAAGLWLRNSTGRRRETSEVSAQIETLKQEIESHDISVNNIAHIKTIKVQSNALNSEIESLEAKKDNLQVACMLLLSILGNSQDQEVVAGIKNKLKTLKEEWGELQESLAEHLRQRQEFAKEQKRLLAEIQELKTSVTDKINHYEKRWNDSNCGNDVLEYFLTGDCADEPLHKNGLVWMLLRECDDIIAGRSVNDFVSDANEVIQEFQCFGGIVTDHGRITFPFDEYVEAAMASLDQAIATVKNISSVETRLVNDTINDTITGIDTRHMYGDDAFIPDLVEYIVRCELAGTALKITDGFKPPIYVEARLADFRIGATAMQRSDPQDNAAIFYYKGTKYTATRLGSVDGVSFFSFANNLSPV